MSNIETFFAMQAEADVAMVDSGPLLHSWDVEELTGEDDNEVVRFGWTDGEYDYSCILTESGINEGTFDADGKFSCEDHEGEPVVVEFFKLERLVPAVSE